MAKHIFFKNVRTRYSAINPLRPAAQRRFLLLRELFYFSSLALVLLIGLEIIFPRIILAYFNLNYLFLLVVMSGLATLIKK